MIVLKVLRLIYSFFFRLRSKVNYSKKFDITEESELLLNNLKRVNPLMIARFGSNELNIYLNYLSIYKQQKSFSEFIRGNQFDWIWNQSQITLFRDGAGFFPTDEKYLKKYGELMESDILELDLLASWISNERVIEDKLKDVKKIFIRSLEPFWSEVNWCQALEGKKVLVIHPFTKEIKHQYNKKQLLFERQILPDFELITYKPVMSLGQNRTAFTTWFDALEFMKNEIDEIDYDIALIGAGAYGFHLAAHIKRQGMKAIHMGGALQLLFGIRGKRWEDPNYGVKEWGLEKGTYSSLMNEH
jgi:hypothetical protein